VSEPRRVRPRAVIFDLWDTLVAWPLDEAEELRVGIAGLIGVDEPEFGRRWRDSYRTSQTGPLADALRAVGLPEEHVEARVAAHHAFARKVLRPRAGAVETLRELRRRGLRLAVLSNCSEDVPVAWPATVLAGLFDVETFSSACGTMKPDPEIYLATAEALGVEPAECLFVGDGANDELGGAARVGMTPVLFLLEGATPHWAEVADWEGLRVRSIADTLALV
jgi:putative hydrolase of the HAD superfamily